MFQDLHDDPREVQPKIWPVGATMRRYVIVLVVVTAWAVFSYMYLGVEDGSSGLSPLGWLHATFFIPGGCLMQVVKGSHGNADLPLMAAVSWVSYALLSVGIVYASES